MASDDVEQQQDVVNTIRDRIRSNALDLLARAETRRPSTVSSGGGGTPLSTGVAGGFDKSGSALHVEDEKKDDHSPSGGSGMASPKALKEETTGAGAGGATPPLSPAADELADSRRRSTNLTQRLQQLALNRMDSMDQRKRLRIIQSDAGSHLSSCKRFQELELPDYLLKAVFEMGLDRPSAIQEAALPRILSGRNLIGQAQSGSGKTVAFALGLLYQCTVNTPATTQGLVLTPTRELAIQVVEQALQPMSAYMKGLKIKLAISGEQYKKGSKVDAHIVVGTPGKVVDW